MSKFAFVALSCAFTFGLLNCAAQTADSSQKRAFESLPPVILYGLDAYRDKGFSEAVQTWIKGSPLEASREVLDQADTLRKTQALYGAYKFFRSPGQPGPRAQNEGFLSGIELRKGAAVCPVCRLPL